MAPIVPSGGGSNDDQEEDNGSVDSDMDNEINSCIDYLMEDSSPLGDLEDGELCDDSNDSEKTVILPPEKQYRTPNTIRDFLSISEGRQEANCPHHGTTPQTSSSLPSDNLFSRREPALTFSTCCNKPSFDPSKFIINVSKDSTDFAAGHEKVPQCSKPDFGLKEAGPESKEQSSTLKEKEIRERVLQYLNSAVLNPTLPAQRSVTPPPLERSVSPPLSASLPPVQRSVSPPPPVIGPIVTPYSKNSTKDQVKPTSQSKNNSVFISTPRNKSTDNSSQSGPKKQRNSSKATSSELRDSRTVLVPAVEEFLTEEPSTENEKATSADENNSSFHPPSYLGTISGGMSESEEGISVSRVLTLVDILKQCQEQLNSEGFNTLLQDHRQVLSDVNHYYNNDIVQLEDGVINSIRSFLQCATKKGKEGKKKKKKKKKEGDNDKVLVKSQVVVPDPETKNRTKGQEEPTSGKSVSSHSAANSSRYSRSRKSRSLSPRSRSKSKSRSPYRGRNLTIRRKRPQRTPSPRRKNNFHSWYRRSRSRSRSRSPPPRSHRRSRTRSRSRSRSYSRSPPSQRREFAGRRTSRSPARTHPSRPWRRSLSPRRSVSPRRPTASSRLLSPRRSPTPPSRMQLNELREKLKKENEAAVKNLLEVVEPSCSLTGLGTHNLTIPANPNASYLGNSNDFSTPSQALQTIGEDQCSSFAETNHPTQYTYGVGGALEPVARDPFQNLYTAPNEVPMQNIYPCSSHSNQMMPVFLEQLNNQTHDASVMPPGGAPSIPNAPLYPPVPPPPLPPVALISQPMISSNTLFLSNPVFSLEQGLAPPSLGLQPPPRQLSQAQPHSAPHIVPPPRSLGIRSNLQPVPLPVPSPTTKKNLLQIKPSVASPLTPSANYYDPLAPEEDSPPGAIKDASKTNTAQTSVQKPPSAKETGVNNCEGEEVVAVTPKTISSVSKNQIKLNLVNSNDQDVLVLDTPPKPAPTVVVLDDEGESMLHEEQRTTILTTSPLVIKSVEAINNSLNTGKTTSPNISLSEPSSIMNNRRLIEPVTHDRSKSGATATPPTEVTPGRESRGGSSSGSAGGNVPNSSSKKRRPRPPKKREGRPSNQRFPSTTRELISFFSKGNQQRAEAQESSAKVTPPIVVTPGSDSRSESVNVSNSSPKKKRHRHQKRRARKLLAQDLQNTTKNTANDSKTASVEGNQQKPPAQKSSPTVTSPTDVTPGSDSRSESVDVSNSSPKKKRHHRHKRRGRNNTANDFKTTSVEGNQQEGQSKKHPSPKDTNESNAVEKCTKIQMLKSLSQKNQFSGSNLSSKPEPLSATSCLTSTRISTDGASQKNKEPNKKSVSIEGSAEFERSICKDLSPSQSAINTETSTTSTAKNIAGDKDAFKSDQAVTESTGESFLAEGSSTVSKLAEKEQERIVKDDHQNSKLSSQPVEQATPGGGICQSGKDLETIPRIDPVGDAASLRTVSTLPSSQSSTCHLQSSRENLEPTVRLKGQTIKVDHQKQGKNLLSAKEIEKSCDKMSEINSAFLTVKKTGNFISIGNNKDPMKYSLAYNITCGSREEFNEKSHAESSTTSSMDITPHVNKGKSEEVVRPTGTPHERAHQVDPNSSLENEGIESEHQAHTPNEEEREPAKIIKVTPQKPHEINSDHSASKENKRINRPDPLITSIPSVKAKSPPPEPSNNEEKNELAEKTPEINPDHPISKENKGTKSSDSSKTSLHSNKAESLVPGPTNKTKRNEPAKETDNIAEEVTESNTDYSTGILDPKLANKEKREENLKKTDAIAEEIHEIQSDSSINNTVSKVMKIIDAAPINSVKNKKLVKGIEACQLKTLEIKKDCSTIKENKETKSLASLSENNKKEEETVKKMKAAPGKSQENHAHSSNISIERKKARSHDHAPANDKKNDELGKSKGISIPEKSQERKRDCSTSKEKKKTKDLCSLSGNKEKKEELSKKTEATLEKSHKMRLDFSVTNQERTKPINPGSAAGNQETHEEPLKKIKTAEEETPENHSGHSTREEIEESDGLHPKRAYKEKTFLKKAHQVESGHLHTSKKIRKTKSLDQTMANNEQEESARKIEATPETGYEVSLAPNTAQEKLASISTASDNRKKKKYVSIITDTSPIVILQVDSGAPKKSEGKKKPKTISSVNEVHNLSINEHKLDGSESSLTVDSSPADSMKGEGKALVSHFRDKEGSKDFTHGATKENIPMHLKSVSKPDEETPKIATDFASKKCESRDKGSKNSKETKLCQSKFQEPSDTKEYCSATSPNRDSVLKTFNDISGKLVNSGEKSVDNSCSNNSIKDMKLHELSDTEETCSASKPITYSVLKTFNDISGKLAVSGDKSIDKSSSNDSSKASSTQNFNDLSGKHFKTHRDKTSSSNSKDDSVIEKTTCNRDLKSIEKGKASSCKEATRDQNKETTKSHKRSRVLSTSSEDSVSSEQNHVSQESESSFKHKSSSEKLPKRSITLSNLSVGKTQPKVQSKHKSQSGKSNLTFKNLDMSGSEAAAYVNVKIPPNVTIRKCSVVLERLHRSLSSERNRLYLGRCKMKGKIKQSEASKEAKSKKISDASSDPNQEMRKVSTKKPASLPHPDLRESKDENSRSPLRRPPEDLEESDSEIADSLVIKRCLSILDSDCDKNSDNEAPRPVQKRRASRILSDSDSTPGNSPIKAPPSKRRLSELSTDSDEASETSKGPAPLQRLMSELFTDSDDTSPSDRKAHQEELNRRTSKPAKDSNELEINPLKRRNSDPVPDDSKKVRKVKEDASKCVQEKLLENKPKFAAKSFRIPKLSSQNKKPCGILKSNDNLDNRSILNDRNSNTILSFDRPKDRPKEVVHKPPLKGLRHRSASLANRTIESNDKFSQAQTPPSENASVTRERRPSLDNKKCSENSVSKGNLAHFPESPKDSEKSILCNEEQRPSEKTQVLGRNSGEKTPKDGEVSLPQSEEPSLVQSTEGVCINSSGVKPGENEAKPSAPVPLSEDLSQKPEPLKAQDTSKISSLKEDKLAMQKDSEEDVSSINGGFFSDQSAKDGIAKQGTVNIVKSTGEIDQVPFKDDVESKTGAGSQVELPREADGVSSKKQPSEIEPLTVMKIPAKKRKSEKAVLDQGGQSEKEKKARKSSTDRGMSANEKRPKMRKENGKNCNSAAECSTIVQVLSEDKDKSKAEEVHPAQHSAKIEEVLSTSKPKLGAPQAESSSKTEDFTNLLPSSRSSLTERRTQQFQRKMKIRRVKILKQKKLKKENRSLSYKNLRLKALLVDCKTKLRKERERSVSLQKSLAQSQNCSSVSQSTDSATRSANSPTDVSPGVSSTVSSDQVSSACPSKTSQEICPKLKQKTHVGQALNPKAKKGQKIWNYLQSQNSKATVSCQTTGEKLDCTLLVTNYASLLNPAELNLSFVTSALESYKKSLGEDS